MKKEGRNNEAAAKLRKLWQEVKEEQKPDDYLDKRSSLSTLLIGSIDISNS